MTQNFMDVLRKKKEEKKEKKENEKIDEDYATGDEDISDFAIDEEQDTDVGVSQEVGEDAKERDGRELADIAERKQKRLREEKQARAKNIRLWRELLETYSLHENVKDENMKELVSQFSKTYLRPKKNSVAKIMKFYSSLVPKNKEDKPTADEKLLDVFYDKMSIPIQNIKGLDLLQQRNLAEKEYNGKPSLELLRGFLEAISDVTDSALRGKVMTRSKLDSLNRLLLSGIEAADSVEDEMTNVTGTNLDKLLENFRLIIINLAKVKRELQKQVKKSGTIDSEDTGWLMPEVHDFYTQEVDFQRAKEKIPKFSYLPDDLRDRADYLIDKVEEIYKAICYFIDAQEKDMVEGETPELEKVVEKAKKHKSTMERLVDVMIGDYEFPIKDDEMRAIKIN